MFDQKDLASDTFSPTNVIKMCIIKCTRVFDENVPNQQVRLKYVASKLANKNHSLKSNKCEDKNTDSN